MTCEGLLRVIKIGRCYAATMAKLLELVTEALISRVIVTVWKPAFEKVKV